MQLCWSSGRNTTEFDGAYYLEDYKCQEVNVGNPGELLEEVQRHEGEDVVLGRDHQIFLGKG